MSDSPVVLVTGAAGGMGAAIAQRFALAGWRVCCTDIDALVNTAGVWREGLVDGCSEDDFDVVMDVNAKSTFFVCAAAIPALRATRGAIVNISSDAGRQGNLNAAAYCASKGAVTLFTKALALELAPHDVRANVVSPAAASITGADFALDRGYSAGK